ncbi:hypothetical protein [Streptomyces asiaticus]|uniref:hypothetical protein n=1 Tax=Streptomyces asiaticus TaxID=114695 RepID=UPI003F680BD5
MKLSKLLSRKPRVEVVEVPVDLNPALKDAIRGLAEVFGDGMTSSETGPSFTCLEADSIARVLLLSGHKEDALRWLEGHADGDEVDDLHYTYDENDPEDEGRVLNKMELREYAGSLIA